MLTDYVFKVSPGCVVNYRAEQVVFSSIFVAWEAHVGYILGGDIALGGGFLD